MNQVFERAERLFDAGAVAEVDVERASVAVATAQAQLDEARARLSLANEQLAATHVDAPISGVVSVRSVAAGDVVQPGAPLYTIVDPSSMRLEAAVPASRLTGIRLGATVDFTVTGYPNRGFIGSVERINPTADPATGQVQIAVSIPNGGGDLVAGLFAEGRIGSETATGLVLPDEAVDETASPPSVLRVTSGIVERVAVRIDLRDDQDELVLIGAGLSQGDTVLVGWKRSPASTASTDSSPCPSTGSPSSSSSSCSRRTCRRRRRTCATRSRRSGATCRGRWRSRSSAGSIRRSCPSCRSRCRRPRARRVS